MDKRLKDDLLLHETDLDGAIERFGSDEELYISCLRSFLSDTTLFELKTAIDLKDWDAAFTAVHAFKGLVANMGFVPLFHSAAEFVVVLRTGKTGEIDSRFYEINSEYKKLTDAILEYFASVDKT